MHTLASPSLLCKFGAPKAEVANFYSASQREPSPPGQHQSLPGLRTNGDQEGPMQSRQCLPPLWCVLDVARQAILNETAPMGGRTIDEAGPSPLALAEEEADTSPEAWTGAR